MIYGNAGHFRRAVDVSIALKEEEEMQIKITVGDTELFAIFEDNAIARALVE